MHEGNLQGNPIEENYDKLYDLKRKVEEDNLIGFKIKE